MAHFLFRPYAIGMGIFFLTLASLPYIPGLMQQEILFKLFKVNHFLNCIHFLTGACALFAAYTYAYYSRLFFQLAGFIYAVLALYGFLYFKLPIFGLIASNAPNNWLHAIVAVTCLILGFATQNALENNNEAQDE